MCLDFCSGNAKPLTGNLPGHTHFFTLTNICVVMDMGNCVSQMSLVQEHFESAFDVAKKQFERQQGKSKHLSKGSSNEMSFNRLFDINDDERRLNYSFVDDGDTFKKIIFTSKARQSQKTEMKQGEEELSSASVIDIEEQFAKWIDQEEWEVMLHRVASKKKPLASVSVVGKLERHFFRKQMERKAHELNVRVIGPYQNSSSGRSMFTLVHTDALDKNITLGLLLSPEDRKRFNEDTCCAIFNAKLEEYITECDIRSGQSYLECALVYGYPLTRALEIERRSVQRRKR